MKNDKIILEPQADNPLARIETKFANAILPTITVPTCKEPYPPMPEEVRKPFREQFQECSPMETLPKETICTAFKGVIDITPWKCIVDGGQCSSGRCPKKK